MTEPSIKIADPDDATYKKLIQHTVSHKDHQRNDGTNTFDHVMLGLEWDIWEDHRKDFPGVAFAEIIKSIAKSVDEGGKAVCKISDLTEANGNRDWSRAITSMKRRGMLVHNNQGDTIALTEIGVDFLLKQVKNMDKYWPQKRKTPFALDKINFIDPNWPDKPSQYKEWGSKYKEGRVAKEERAR